MKTEYNDTLLQEREKLNALVEEALSRNEPLADNHKILSQAWVVEKLLELQPNDLT